MAKEKKNSATQDAKRLEMLERGKRVVELRRLGASFRQIADKLKEEGQAEVTYITVKRDFDAAMKVLVEDHKDEMESFIVLQNMRLNGLFMTYHLMTQQKTETVKDEKTGEEKQKVVKPSISAGYLCAQLIKLLNDTNSIGNIQRHEITGKNGEPIKTVELTLAEWRKNAAARRAQAAKTRELFSDENSENN